MVKKLVLSVFVLTGFIGMPRVAMAGCGGDLLDCYTAAAQIDSFWYRTAAGLDCEFAYADCVRQILLGA
jgi:hypothetical protein